MNVLHVIPAIAPRYGGPTEVVISLARSLIDAGVNTEIVTTDADGDGRLPVNLGSITEFRSVPVRFFRRQFSEAFKFSRTLEKWLQDEVCRFDVVHIHAVFSHSSVAAFKACIRAGVPYIVRPLGSLDPETYAHKTVRKRLFSAIWGKRMLAEASAVHYSTAREQKLVEERFDLRHGFIAPAGVEVDACPGFRTEDPHRANAPGRPYIVFLGRLDQIKRLELLIDAFAEVSSEAGLKEWRLLIVGDGEPAYARQLRHHAGRTKAAERIEFSGWLSGQDKARALQNAELLALLSRHENFGRAAAEAMFLGVPVVISDQVFLAEDVRRYGAGWVSRDAPKDVRRTLRDAMANPMEREQAGLAARRLAEDQYNARRATELLLARYESLTDRRETHPA